MPARRPRPRLGLEPLEDRSTPALLSLDTTDQTVAATAGFDRSPDVAVRPDGTGFVVTYVSSDGSGDGIFLRRYDAAWQPIGTTPTAVNTFTANNQQGPAVAVDAAGNFVVTWQSFGQDPGDSTAEGGVYARRYRADGSAVDAAEFRVNATTTSQQRDPDVAAAADGRFVIVWRGPAVNTDIYAQSYAGITAGGSGNPTKVGGESLVNDTAAVTSVQGAPVVAVLANGGYVVVYQSASQDNAPATDRGVYARLMNADGTPNGAEFLVNTGVQAGNQQTPDVASDGSGNFAVVWTSDNVDGSGTAVVMQRYAADGSAVGTNTQVNTVTTQNNQLDPRIVMNAAGAAVITWNGEEADGDATGTDVYFKTYDAAGNVRVGETVFNLATAGDDQTQEDAAPGITASGDFVITFSTASAGATDAVLRRFAEAPTVAFSAATSSTAESGSASVSLTRTGPVYVLANVATTVQVTRTGGTATPPGTGQDFSTAFPASVTFPANGPTTQTFAVTITPDTTDEADETIELGLGTVTGGTAAGQTTHTLTITDDDPPPNLSIDDVSITEGDSGTTAAAFTVTLSAASGQTVGVNYTLVYGTAGSTDVQAVSGTLTFAPGVTSQPVTIQVAGDARVEADETFTVSLSSPTNATISDGDGLGTIVDNDAPVSLVVLSGNNQSAIVGTGFTNPLTVEVRNANGTLVEGASVTFTAPSSGASAVFSTGTNAITVTTTAAGTAGTGTFTANDTVGASYTVTAQASGGANPSAGFTLTNAPLPSLSIGDVTVTEGDSGATAATFTVTLSAASTASVSVGYTVVFGTAGSGDVQAASGTLTFDPGVTSQPVAVLVIGDARVEADETFTVSLSSPVNATITDGEGMGTIADNDAPASVTVIGGNNQSAMTGTSFAVPLAVEVRNASGTLVEGASVTFTAPASGASAVFSTGTNAITVTTSAAGVAGTGTLTANGTAGSEYAVTARAAGGSNSAADFTLSNFAPPSLTIDDVSVTEGDGGTRTLTFTVSASPAHPSATITVDWQTADGTATTADGDYTAAGGTLTFAPNETTKTVVVTVRGDVRNEANETVLVNLTNAANAIITDGQGVGAITDDDPLPTVSIGNTTVSEGSSGSASLSFTVTLSAVSGRTVTVAYATADGSATAADNDYQATTAGTVTFLPGETSKTVVVAVNGDAKFETDEALTVVLSSPSNATLGTATGTGTITNDDAVPRFTLSLAGSPFAENGGVATVTATLSNPSHLPVTVALFFPIPLGGMGVAVQPGDYTPSGTTIVIPAGTLSGSITLTASDDPWDELAETITVSVTAVTNGIEATPQVVTATITDDDLPVAAADGYTVTEDAGIVISDVEFPQSTAPTTGVFKNDNAASGSVAERVGPGPAHGTLTLFSNGNFRYFPAADFVGTDSFQYRVRNTAGEVSAPVTVTFTVAAVNDAPSFTRGADQTLARGSGPQTVPGWAATRSAGPADEAGQSLAFVVTTDHPEAFAALPTVDPLTGTLRYTPAADWYGTAVVTVRLKDSGGTAEGGEDASAPQTFTVTVNKHLTENRAVGQNEVTQFAAGAGAGGPGTLTVYGADGSPAYSVRPFPDGTGVRAVLADATGDGVPDVVAATGPGVAGQVVILDGTTRQTVRSFTPFGPAFTGGVMVAAGDVNGDGFADVAVSADESGGPRVQIFDGQTGAVVANFYGIEEPDFRGGTRVAFGDVNADGVADLVVAAGTGGGPRVAVYDGRSLRAGQKPAKLVPDFFAFEAGLRDGVFVTVGDVNGDGFDDLVFGAGPGGGPRVTALDGRSLFAAPGGSFVVLTNFFAAEPVLRNGVRLAVKDLDGDRKADLITSVPSPAGSVVKLTLGSDLGAGGGDPSAVWNLFPGLLSGVFIG